MANRFTPPEKLLPARAKRSLVKPTRWTPDEWERIENAARRAGETPVELVRRRVLTGLKAAVVALALGLATGCVDTGGFSKLSQADQDTFKRCMKPIEPALCGNITSDVYEGMCLGGGQKTYAAQATPRARQEWLVANGCPPSMVQPAKFVSDEGGAK